jgi:hypothetical protein
METNKITLRAANSIFLLFFIVFIYFFPTPDIIDGYIQRILCLQSKNLNVINNFT